VVASIIMKKPLPRVSKKIAIEIVFARNPVIRNWFTNPKAAKQIAPYLAAGIQLSGLEYTQGEVVGVDMEGRVDLVNNFERTFLNDEGPEIYGQPA
jgi:hypothetical protein